eukprot:s18_g49.t1
MASVDDVPRDLEGSFLAKKEWQYPVEDRSGWLPANAQELADNHPWTRRAVEKNPRFPGYVPPEALFCWTEPDFASYINSGGFELNWTCTVDSKTGREESLAQVTDYMGMPVPTLKKQADGSLEVVKPRDDIAPIFIWESSRWGRAWAWGWGRVMTALWLRGWEKDGPFEFNDLRKRNGDFFVENWPTVKLPEGILLI